jgi:hypothetical protein
MRASDWVKTIPPGRGDARDEAILQAVRDRNIVVDWNPVYSDVGNSRAMFLVSNALQVGERGDSIRVFTSQQRAQQIADDLSSTLPTQRIADLMYHYAEQKLVPQTSNVGDMSTQHMIDQSARLDALVEDPKLLVANEGKHWLNHSKLITEPIQDGMPSAVNYGWHITKPLSYGHNYRTTLPGILTIQGPYTGHGYEHEDYSQYVYLVARRVEVCEPEAIAGLGAQGEEGYPCLLPDGELGRTRVYDIYRMVDDPQLKQFFSAGDPTISQMRHPSVEWESSEVKSFDPGWPPRPGAVPQPDGPPPYPPGYQPAEPLAAGPNLPARVAALVGGGIAGYYAVRLLGDWFRGG